ncbi:unnamed protein product [Cyprideis torosa]|uniref:Transmembrane protein 188 n=1 Tax=Cyprideis torosa TaxID=163714 RepID=A0A7R8ZL08_9CRUS|nr:unnamed protein product [Cyprideis torosa]CAG0881362.1 unnamed protein product [Cyprideis torosa]
MSLEQTACDDLKAFERRLTEVISNLQPTAYKWRVLLVLVTVVTAVTAWQWITDAKTANVGLLESLVEHKLFALSALLMLSLFLAGIHRRVVAPSLICARARLVLEDFNMSCDDSGKLILRPRPHSL